MIRVLKAEQTGILEHSTLRVYLRESRFRANLRHSLMANGDSARIIAPDLDGDSRRACRLDGSNLSIGAASMMGPDNGIVNGQFAVPRLNDR